VPDVVSFKDDPPGDCCPDESNPRDTLVGSGFSTFSVSRPPCCDNAALTIALCAGVNTTTRGWLLVATILDCNATAICSILSKPAQDAGRSLENTPLYGDPPQVYKALISKEIH
jgi:hypothetical protein